MLFSDRLLSAECINIINLCSVPTVSHFTCNFNIFRLSVHMYNKTCMSNPSFTTLVIFFSRMLILYQQQPFKYMLTQLAQHRNIQVYTATNRYRRYIKSSCTHSNITAPLFVTNFNNRLSYLQRKA